MTPPRLDRPPHSDREPTVRRSSQHGPYPRYSHNQTQQEWARNGDPEWDWPLIAMEALTVAVCAPLAVVLIATDVADQMSAWWWLVVAGMLATWAGESVGKLAAHVSAVRAARARHRSQRAHTGDQHLRWGDHQRHPDGHESPGRHVEMPPRSDDRRESGGPR